MKSCSRMGPTSLEENITEIKKTIYMAWIEIKCFIYTLSFWVRAFFHSTFIMLKPPYFDNP